MYLPCIVVYMPGASEGLWGLDLGPRPPLKGKTKGALPGVQELGFAKTLRDGTKLCIGFNQGNCREQVFGNPPKCNKGVHSLSSHYLQKPCTPQVSPRLVACTPRIPQQHYGPWRTSPPQ